MNRNFEYVSKSERDRLRVLETRTVELERMLASVAPDMSAEGSAEPFEVPASPFGVPGDAAGGPRPDGRTEALINGGRANTAPSRLGRFRDPGFFREHWQASVTVAGALAVLLIIVGVTASGGGKSAAWPASVARMQAQITTACQNPNVAAEPSQLNFACGPGTRQVLWVFGLLTSGGNPRYADASTGRRGLEPITPSQGGDVAWSLNLHEPYDPANPVDSLEVAARAINNIIGGATLTNSAGQPSVQPGLESQAANCRRYTGSPDLTRRPGFPAVCARALTASGEQALVSDVFGQWMTGAPAQTAANAGVLFANSANPADPRVQAILNSLPGSGQ